MTPSAALPVTALLALLIAPVAQAQSYRSAPVAATMLIEVEGEASDAETLRLLTGLGEIRADVKLGLLFLEEGLKNPEGSHFVHAREKVLPAIAEGLAAAGAPDLLPLLQALEAAKGDAVKDAYHDVEAALLRARSVLNPSSGQVLQSVVDMARAAAKQIDPSGTTPVADYQFAWEILIVARGELDLLARDQDRAIAQQAGEKAMAFDDLILFMPDPHQPAPVAFDRALILDLIGKLEDIGSDA